MNTLPDQSSDETANARSSTSSGFETRSAGVIECGVPPMSAKFEHVLAPQEGAQYHAASCPGGTKTVLDVGGHIVFAAFASGVIAKHFPAMCIVRTENEGFLVSDHHGHWSRWD